MQREAQVKDKDGPKLGRKGKLEEIGRLVVDALGRSDPDPLEGLDDLLADTLNMDDAIALIRAKLRARARRAEKAEAEKGAPA
jgi:hypothetical protein